MTLLNKISDTGTVTRTELRTFLILLNPFAPHITEEMWENMGFDAAITDQAWPSFEEAKTKEDTIEIAVQVNGRIRAKLMVARDITNVDAIAKAKELKDITPYIDGKTIRKEIYVPGRLVNIVVG